MWVERQGLPPRGRGECGWCSPVRWWTGTTPAQAGLTVWRALGSGAPWDYPRTGGAYTARRVSGADRWGLPPRRRGLPAEYLHPSVCPRTTPAQAGLTLSDQPLYSAGRLFSFPGSTARRQHKPRGPVAAPPRQGIAIPSRSSVQHRSDSPRTGGAYCCGTGTHPPSAGLPPHRRGLLDGVLARGEHPGTTPAQAGLIVGRPALSKHRGDYPHTGRAYPGDPADPPGFHGLSPHRQGGLFSCRWGGRPEVTTARAPPPRRGLTRPPATPPSTMPDYPRTGGALPTGFMGWPMCPGYPPPGRGRTASPRSRSESARDYPRPGRGGR